MTWTNFQEHQLTRRDTVNFGTTGTLGGNVTAATLNDTTYTGAVTVGLTGTGAGTITGVAGTFSGVSAINANSANSNTMGGSGATYVLDARRRTRAARTA